MKKTWLAFFLIAIATFWLIIIVPFAFSQNQTTVKKQAENVFVSSYEADPTIYPFNSESVQSSQET